MITQYLTLKRPDTILIFLLLLPLSTQTLFAAGKARKVTPEKTGIKEGAVQKTKAPPKVLTCSYEECGKTYKYQGCLRKHEESHTEEKFQCLHQGCDRIYKHQTSLQNHERTHTGERFYCPIPGCDKSYSRPSGLKDHERVHTGNLIPCDYPGCEKSYPAQNALNVHKRIHADEKSFACQEPGCNKAFTQKVHLFKHKTFHEKGQFAVCQEPGCNKAFNIKSKFISHENWHKKQTIRLRESAEKPDPLQSSPGVIQNLEDLLQHRKPPVFSHRTNHFPIEQRLPSEFDKLIEMATKRQEKTKQTQRGEDFVKSVLTLGRGR